MKNEACVRRRQASHARPSAASGERRSPIAVTGRQWEQEKTGGRKRRRGGCASTRASQWGCPRITSQAGNPAPMAIGAIVCGGRASAQGRWARWRSTSHKQRTPWTHGAIVSEWLANRSRGKGGPGGEGRGQVKGWEQVVVSLFFFCDESN